MPGSVDATDVLLESTVGSAGATDRLATMVYAELRDLAGALLRRERSDHTLQVTELVHEAYLRMVDQTRCQWQNRAHFLGVASRAMRRILVDHARRRGAGKRGGGLQKLSLDDELVIGTDESNAVLLSLDLALDKLATLYPDVARAVEVRFFGGLTHDECAFVLGVSPRQAFRHWEFARAWLHREIGTQ